jgi:PucR C-terminal helix-turn-helix domain
MASSDAFAPPHGSRLEIAAIVDGLGADLDEISATLADAIHEHLPELDDDMRVWTLQSTRANLGVMVTLMRDAADPRSAPAPPEAVGYAKEYVVRGLDIALLQRAYRTAQGAFAGIILGRVRLATDDPDLLTDAMAFFNAWLFAWIEAIERQLTEVHIAEREQWVRGAAAMRAAEVRALLAGAREDPAAVSRRLGYELERFHVGFVVWSESAEDAPGEAGALFGEMERVAAAVAESLGGAAPLTVAQGRHLACWTGALEPQYLGALEVPAVGGSGAAAEQVDAAAASEVGAAEGDAPVGGSDTAAGRGDATAAVTGSGISVAAGTAARGVEGFVLSHREALAARRVARLRGGAPSPALYPDLALEALLLDDVDAAARFVARELGPLAAPDEPTVRLATTLAVFLEEGASFVGAARRLGVHTNTVTYRVHRAEELRGRPVTDRQLELRLALRLSPLLG